MFSKPLSLLLGGILSGVYFFITRRQLDFLEEKLENSQAISNFEKNLKKNVLFFSMGKVVFFSMLILSCVLILPLDKSMFYAGIAAILLLQWSMALLAEKI